MKLDAEMKVEGSGGGAEADTNVSEDVCKQSEKVD